MSEIKDRIIFHIDINHCFAQIEEMMNPELRNVAMCVGGDEKSRSGIVLARNLKAKEYGVQTAETLRDAKKKCPHLVVVTPHSDLYMYYTSKVKDIYREYTDKVESYGADEAWIDVTESYHLFGKPYDLAYEMQRRVLEEYGLTVSVGVSWNKVFAKLGSDLIKPSGMTIITRSNYKEIVWPLPVSELLYVGKQTTPKLNALGIYTIGDLATSSVKKLEKHFGVKGLQMWEFANGIEEGDVDYSGVMPAPKSIGNSTTPPHDINTNHQAKIIFRHLADSVASRLHDEKMKGFTISISLRDIQLVTITRQKRISKATNNSTEILKTAMMLLEENYTFNIPLRSIGISVSNLIDNPEFEQISIFENTKESNQKQAIIDDTIDKLRDKFGYNVIKRASAVMDKDTENFDAKRRNVLYPGRKKDYDVD
ncbi:DNA polymerase IV [Erysipelothrix sp. HDW6A]|uniref:DNA polymerase IV n=1 Tax=Erysipelothrix sp. HDW6A TaxID=2714928 RepID=UPI00140CC680|nr:DNA polymerase IV [Erysipelothrix sp. HDW6A]QIK57612.1 DNA polymerase IV [Erysipelothrix sp. HDW6A]